MQRKEAVTMSQQEGNRDRVKSSLLVIRGVPRHRDYSIGLMSRGRTPSAGQRLALAIVSIISLMVVVYFSVMGAVNLGHAITSFAEVMLVVDVMLFFAAV